jgi:hypothetical protein
VRAKSKPPAGSANGVDQITNNGPAGVTHHGTKLTYGDGHAPAWDTILRIASVTASTTREVTMKRWLVIAASAVFLFVAACAAKSEEKTRISDGVVKLGMIEDMSSIYADITGVGAVRARHVRSD